MSEEIFSTELPDIKAMIKKLDLLDEDVNKAIREAMHEGADIIMKEQKRLISDVSPKLADTISKSNVYATRKGEIGISVGYQQSAFKEDSEGFNPGVVGMTWEFGRPGQSSQRSGKTMKQKRMVNDSTGEKVAKEIDVKKGKIDPHPHIWKGFDTKKAAAVKVVADAVERIVKKNSD